MPGNFGLAKAVNLDAAIRLIPVPGGLTTSFNTNADMTLSRLPSKLNQQIGIFTTDGHTFGGPLIQAGWIWSAVGTYYDSGFGQSVCVLLGKPDPSQPKTNSTTVQVGDNGGFPTKIIYEIYGQPLKGEVLSIRTARSSSTSTFPIQITKPVPGPSATIVGAVCHSGGNGFDGTHVPANGWVISSSALGGISFAKGAHGRCVTTFAASGGRNWSAAIVQVR